MNRIQLKHTRATWLLVESMAGAERGACFLECAAMAADRGIDIVLLHNGQAYSIPHRKITDIIFDAIGEPQDPAVLMKDAAQIK